MKESCHFIGFYSRTLNSNDLRPAIEVWLTIIRNSGFDSVKLYDKTDVKAMSDAPLNLFDSQTALYKELLKRQGRSRLSWAELNFFYWKPFLLSKVLDRKDIRVGDWIFYHDLNYFAYPDYLQDNDKWVNYLLNKKKAEILLFNDDLTSILVDVKKELIRGLLGYGFIRSFWTSHVWAGAIAIRKGDIARNFLDEWLSLTSDIFARGCEQKLQQSKHFWWHSVDQACLTVTYLDPRWMIFKKNGVIQRDYLRQSRVIPPPELTFERKLKILSVIYIKLFVFLKSILLLRF